MFAYSKGASMKYSQRVLFQTITLVIIVLFTTGCVVQSLHRHYTIDTAIETPKDIIGKWQFVGKRQGKEVVMKQMKPWEFSNTTLVTYDTNNVKSLLKFKFFKVGKHLYCDFTSKGPDKNMRKSVNFYWVLNVMPVHTMTKVIRKDNKLYFHPLSDTWVKRQVNEKKVDLAFVKTEENVELFTNTPRQWVEFLKKHGDTLEAFSSSPFIILQKPGGATDTGTGAKAPTKTEEKPKTPETTDTKPATSSATTSDNKPATTPAPKAEPTIPVTPK
jgi:hypothetical protein